MSYSKDIEKAREIARAAHSGSVDKAGAPYILHPERVASRVADAEAKVVAWLHDVVEDTDVTIETIRALFGPDTANAVYAITHKKGENWADYLIRVKCNDVARRVKISDLIDNMNLGRFEVVTPKDIKRTEKYLRALIFLTDAEGE